jgi:putative transposase
MLLNISRSGLYYKTLVREDEIELLNRIRDIWSQCPFYGYRKITVVLNRDSQMVVNHKRVQRLMHEGGMEALYPKPNLSKKVDKSVWNYLLRDLCIERVNQVWMIDITYLKLGTRFVYLVAVIDVFSRYIVGWNLAYDLDTENSLDALRLGLKMGIPEIVNSDQGCQYTSLRWIEVLQSLSIAVSHDGVGRWADNIHIERFWRTIKYEAIYLNDYDDYHALYVGISNYIEFYNHERPHQALKYKTPSMIYYSS